LGERLQDAIVALRPDAASADSLAERRYRLVSLRYLEGLEQADVERALAISRSTYHREHAGALAAG